MSRIHDLLRNYQNHIRLPWLKASSWERTMTCIYEPADERQLRPVPQAFRESMGYAEQNLYANATSLVGDRDPRHHEFSVQLRAFDTSKSGKDLGVAALVALSSSLLQKSVRGGLVIAGSLNLGGSIGTIYNALNIAELAVEKGASLLLLPVSCRRQLYDLSDEMATKIDIRFYADARDALFKSLIL